MADEGGPLLLTPAIIVTGVLQTRAVLEAASSKVGHHAGLPSSAAIGLTQQDPLACTGTVLGAVVSYKAVTQLVIDAIGGAAAVCHWEALCVTVNVAGEAGTAFHAGAFTDLGGHKFGTGRRAGCHAALVHSIGRTCHGTVCVVPPTSHVGACLLANDGIATEDTTSKFLFFFGLPASAHIQHTALLKGLWGYDLVTCSKGSLGVHKHPTGLGAADKRSLLLAAF